MAVAPVLLLRCEGEVEVGGKTEGCCRGDEYRLSGET